VFRDPTFSTSSLIERLNSSLACCTKTQRHELWSQQTIDSTLSYGKKNPKSLHLDLNR